MTAATFDPAKELKVYLRINRDGQLTLAFNIELDDYTVVWNIYKREGDATPFLQLTEASGLTKTTDRIVAAITKAQAARFRDQTYFHEIIRTHADTGEKTWLTGDFVAHNGKFDGLTLEGGSSTGSITINEGDTIVNITISDSAGDGGGGQTDVGLLLAEVTIPSADVNNAYISPIEVIAAPGAGMAICPILVIMTLDYGGTPYDTNGNVRFTLGTPTFTGSGELFVTADSVWNYNTNMFFGSVEINVPLNFTVEIGNPTAGNSDVKVRVLYKVVAI